MSERILHRRMNGKFRRAPSLEEMGLDVAKGAKMCECGQVWNPLVRSGLCPTCGSHLGVMLDGYRKEASPFAAPRSPEVETSDD